MKAHSSGPISATHPPTQKASLRRLLIRPLDHPAKLLELDILPQDATPRLVLLVQRDHDLLALDPPPADLPHEAVELGARDAEPALEDAPLHLLHALAHHHRDPHAHQLLEPLHVGDEVRVQVVAVERVPEGVVLGVVELGVQDGEVLDGLGQGAGGGCGAVLLRVARLGEDVGGKEGEAEAEVGGGEDGEGFGQDVGRGFELREVRVELVSVRPGGVS